MPFVQAKQVIGTTDKPKLVTCAGVQLVFCLCTDCRETEQQHAGFGMGKGKGKGKGDDVLVYFNNDQLCILLETLKAMVLELHSDPFLHICIQDLPGVVHVQ